MNKIIGFVFLGCFFLFTVFMLPLETASVSLTSQGFGITENVFQVFALFSFISMGLLGLIKEVVN